MRKTRRIPEYQVPEGITRLGLVGLRRVRFKVANEGGSPCRLAPDRL